MIPKQLTQEANIFAFDNKGNTIFLALTDPNSPQTQSALKTLSAMDEYTFKPILVSDSTMRYLLSTYDTFAPTVANSEEIIISQIQEDEMGKVTTSEDFLSKIKCASLN